MLSRKALQQPEPPFHRNKREERQSIRVTNDTESGEASELGGRTTTTTKHENMQKVVSLGFARRWLFLSHPQAVDDLAEERLNGVFRGGAVVSDPVKELAPVHERRQQVDGIACVSGRVGGAVSCRVFLFSSWRRSKIPLGFTLQISI